MFNSRKYIVIIILAVVVTAVSCENKNTLTDVSQKRHSDSLLKAYGDNLKVKCKRIITLKDSVAFVGQTLFSLNRSIDSLTVELSVISSELQDAGKSGISDLWAKEKRLDRVRRLTTDSILAKKK
jgi:hypothetical protein